MVKKKLFLLDGMALVYRAHFALVARPIFTSQGVNTSALYGFTQTLLDILKKQEPSHVAVAFDTDAPTQRHRDFAAYKATRQAMPEDILKALPHVNRMLEAFRIPVLTCDGYEADDLIGTLACRAEKEGFLCYMVTPDKDFGQLVTENILIYKPGRMGSDVEIMGVPEIRRRWGIEKPQQVVDLLALMGDSSDNIPGVPGIGEKTAAKLVAQFGTVENLLAHTSELTGRVKESLEKNRDEAILSKKLATLMCDAPCAVDLESLKLQPPDKEKLKALFVEFEFNSIGKRLFGESFTAGRGFQSPSGQGLSEPGGAGQGTGVPVGPLRQHTLVLESEAPPPCESPKPAGKLNKLADVAHEYRLLESDSERADLLQRLQSSPGFGFALQAIGSDPKQAKLAGLAFSLEPHRGFFVPLDGSDTPRERIAQFRSVLESGRLEKTGQDLKFCASVLLWHGVCLGGKLFDCMVAHSLLEPDMRHSLEFLAESYLGYTPAPASEGQANWEVAVEAADLGLQLRSVLEPLLQKKGQGQVFYEIEAPLIPVLVDMEHEGIRVDAAALAEFGSQLAKQLDELEKTICRMAGTTFNLNSPRQLGQILFDVLKICEAPKKTRTGQYATDEQTLASLAPDHEIVQRLLEHRVASKLKSTYADALPAAIWPPTGRIHTTFNQVATATGRLNSQDPNLQNIPIRSERGQEIRKAFVPRGADYLLLSADYSQIELRIIAALSREPGLLEAFQTGVDVHTATAARVYGVFLDMVTPEMRRKAKMVNYGIAYGISAFGLAQRLRIPRKEGAEIINAYFTQFPRIRGYMDETIAFAREHGYVQTVTGRRRYIRDIRSSNNTIRGAAERNAINAPIQGSAADMIKIAMANIHTEIRQRNLRSRMLLQVHDELLFDLFKPEEAELRALVQEKMVGAIALEVPIAVDIGVGQDWLEAH